MRIGTHKPIILVVVLLVLETIGHGDSYVSFQTTRYFSANRHYFIKVTPNKRATLYRTIPRLKSVWTGMLPELPAHVFLANDGTRLATIDHYYGNGRLSSANVVRFFDNHGKVIANHSLHDVANLPHVLHTTSSAHWYYGAFFTADQTTLVIETLVRTCRPRTNSKTNDEPEAQDCWGSQPYEELRFSMVTGQLISRINIQHKYADQETRLRHELEFAENHQPPDDLGVVDVLLELAHYHERQKEFARAQQFYDRAIPIYIRRLGENYLGVAEAVGLAATNYRNLGNYVRAEGFYRRALNSLDKKRGDPRSVSPIAITVYEDYAVLLNALQRGKEASRMTKRAEVLRAGNPDYKK